MILEKCTLFFNKLAKRPITRSIAKPLHSFVYNFLASFYNINIGNKIKHLHGPVNFYSSREQVIVCCLVKDGEQYIESFLAYYFNLGVEHIFFIDNGSKDETINLAKREKRVSIYQTNLKFKVYKNILRRYMIEHFSSDGWALNVDIDEFYDFPFSKEITLANYIGYLNKNSYTAVAAYLLDMVPNKRNVLSSKGERAFSRADYEYYDLSHIVKGKYDKSVSMVNNKINNHAIKSYSGGIRKRVFNIKPTLLKHPLIYFDNKITSYGSHGIGYANVADISCVLYHYKFTDKFMERVNKAVIEENYYSDSREYKAYKKTHEEMGEIELDSKYLKKLTSIDDLLNDGFLQVTSDYKNWVAQISDDGCNDRTI